MIIVSDTSPLINLAAVGQLDLLRHLYDHVIIPHAIYDENVLNLELDHGEAEALALAVELKADLLIIDERRGRVIASRLGLTYIGLLGALMEAKQRGLIRAVKPLLDDLITKAGFWISADLYRRVLQAAAE